MRTARTALLLALMMTAGLAAAPTQAQTSSPGPLVTTDWLKANLGKPGIVVLDVRSGAGKTKADYLKGHVPGAVFTDYAKDGWREKDKNGTPDMLPESAKLEKLIGGLGIDNAAHVVLVPEGARAQDVGAATRIYWTFKVVGHDKVSILDGGWLAWSRIDEKTKHAVNPIDVAEVNPAAKTFRASLRPSMIATKIDVQKAVEAKQVLVDNRPNDFFVGVTKSPAAKKPGTIPNAVSLPESWLTENNGGTFRTREQLAGLYKAAGVPLTGRQVNFCNTGHWASLGWFVSHEIMGNKDVIMYDGSMVEWSADSSLPIEQKVKLQ